MVILHIASLTNSKNAGPNINVPKNVIYGNKFANVALYNVNKCVLDSEIPSGKYFSINNYKNISDLPVPFNNPDIVFFQSVYILKYCSIAKYIKKNKIPYVIVPRCSLTEAANKSKGLKKKIGNLVLFNKFIKNAKYIQFLTQNEYEESKKIFKFKDYFIVGNGIEIPKERYRLKNRKEFKIVFIGRYNVYHKGLDILLNAVKNHKEWFINNNIFIVLYGSNSSNGLEYLKENIASNSLSSIVKLNGPVYGDEKKKTLLDSDMFIHTSRLEGQPTSVIEAISYGIPVIVTPGTNVVDIVKKHNLGFYCELNEQKIFETIKKAFNSKKQFTSISSNEIDYATNHFDWNQIEKELINIVEK